MDQKWFEDMMSQTYNEDICFNPSKLFLLQYMSKNGTIADRYKISDFQRYLYRIYSDNPEVAAKHPSYIIRKIHTYGVNDLEEMAVDTLSMWIRDAKNGVLKCGSKFFALDIKRDEAEEIAQNTMRFATMMYQRKFGGKLPDISLDWNEEELSQDHNLDTFGKGKFLRRVLEDIQYCPICEQIGEENLYCTHIFEEGMGAELSELEDQNNGLVFCKVHAQQYIDNKFYFDEMGFAKDISDSDVEPGMHLSFSVRNSERKKYFIKRLNWLREQGIVTDEE